MNCIAQRRPKEIVSLISAIIAVLPLLNYIRGFFTTNFALDLLIFYAPCMVLLLLLPNPHIVVATPELARYPGWDEFKPAIPALMLALYASIRSGGSYSGAITFALVAVYLVATLSGYFDIQQIFKTIIFVSCVASILVIVQTISYYLFGRYLQMVWLDICRYDIIASYSERIMKGVAEGTSLFRPSAFFLEPSHFAQYAAVGLAGLLFPVEQTKPRYGKIILISLGLICSTSGMGVMIFIYEFILYTILNMKGKSSTTNLFHIIIYCLLAAGAFAALMQINMFHLTIQRVFGQVDGYNAISGRTGSWNNYVTKLSGTELLFGRGMASTNELIYWVTGGISLIYTLGIIGLILFAVMIALGMVKSNKRSLCLGCYYLLITFFSETTVGVAVIFHIIIIYSGRLRT